MKVRLWMAYAWARENKTLVLSFATSLVAVIVAAVPEFPGHAVLSVLSALLGA